MRTISILLTITLTFAGCLSENADPDSVDASLNRPIAVDPFHVDESFDVTVDEMDETWTWSMSDDMAGTVSIEQIANPVTTTDGAAVCYRIEWPTGHQQGGNINCGEGSSGNIGLTFSAAQINGKTIYSANLIPNDFTLRVWSYTNEPAEIRVVIDTNVETD
jgi:hypothetical protein